MRVLFSKRLTEGNPMPRVEFTRLMQLALPEYELNSAIYTRLASALQLILTRNFEENSALDIHNYETEFLNAPPEDWAYFFSLAHPYWSGAGSALLATTTTGPAFLRSRIAHRGGGNRARGFRRRPRPHPSSQRSPLRILRRLETCPQTHFSRSDIIAYANIHRTCCMQRCSIHSRYSPVIYLSQLQLPDCP